MDRWCNPTSRGISCTTLREGLDEMKTFVGRTFAALLDRESDELRHQSSLKLFGALDVGVVPHDGKLSLYVRHVWRGVRTNLWGQNLYEGLNPLLTEVLESLPEYLDSLE